MLRRAADKRVLPAKWIHSVAGLVQFNGWILDSEYILRGSIPFTAADSPRDQKKLQHGSRFGGRLKCFFVEQGRQRRILSRKEALIPFWTGCVVYCRVVAANVEPF